MNPEIIEYIKTQRVCVIAVEMPDGSPHAATVHFAYSENPFTLLFETSPKYRKVEALSSKERVRASVVIGLQEEGGKERTFQMDGEARLLKEDEWEQCKETYFAKFPEKLQKLSFGNDVFFTFTPSWWRFTDWSRPEGKTIYNSDGTITVKGKPKE